MTIAEFIDTGCGIDSFNVIYKLTNTVNNKVYIGQTANSLRKRIIAHLSHSNKYTKSKKHHLQFALQKYGYHNFQIEILETCNRSDLNDREIFWIKYFDSTDSTKGYNCTKGGDGCAIARQIKESTRKKISEANKNKWSDDEYRLRQKKSRIRSHKNRLKKTVQLTYSYDIVKIWDYKKDIATKYNSSIYNLSKDKNYILMGGYIWMNLDDFNNFKLPEPLIVQLDNDFNVLNFFYDYKTANIRIHELTGTYGNLQFNLYQKRTCLNGTKKGGYTWMSYMRYKEIKNESIGYT